jgi:hypothetical protein
MIEVIGTSGPYKGCFVWVCAKRGRNKETVEDGKWVTQKKVENNLCYYFVSWK